MAAAEPAALTDLLAVQDLDRELDGLRHERDTLPQYEVLTKLAAERAALATRVATVDEQRHDLGRSQKRLEDEVALLEDRIAKEQGKLYGGEVTAIKELQALEEEIAGLTKRRTLVEDQILELMEEIEPVDETLATAAENDAQLVGREAEVQAELESGQAEIDEKIADVTTRRSERAAGVTDELMATYEGIRSQPGRIGVARLVGTTCHGCHLELAAVEVDRLKKLPANELVLCEECGCILVR